MGILVGRKREREDLEEYCRSAKAELICVYGRRRVGKTYLVTETFRNALAFDVTGTEDRMNRNQLAAFRNALRRYGRDVKGGLDDWFDAFDQLRLLLEGDDVVRADFGRRVVFLDEFPWLAAQRSNFLAAFSDFWNSWASRQDDMVVIICGSATSWIIKNVFQNTGSMYNRVTRRLYVEPFDLRATEDMLSVLGFDWSRQTVLECYLTFGGLPYYIDMLDRRKSLAQNVDALCFGARAPLRREASLLMEATMNASDLHLDALRVLSGAKAGVQRKRLVQLLGVADGGGVKRMLDDLEQCGYVRSYANRYAKYKPTTYQLVDMFLLFAFRFMSGERKVEEWGRYIGTPSYYSWRGSAFELACMSHLLQIRHALGISGVSSRCFPWVSSESEPGAQIDLVIEREDNVTNICEMKFTNERFAMSADDERDMAWKLEAFRRESHTKSALQPTLVSVNGLQRNRHSDNIAHVVDCDDLFAF